MPVAKSNLPQNPGKPQPRGRLLTVGVAAPRLGRAPQTLYNAFASGKGPLARLPRYVMGRSIRIAEKDLEDFLAARRVEPHGSER